jgi:hypothetical protein
MVRSLLKLNGCVIAAQDGEIGKLRDVYFDDDKWVVRYLVVDLGHWLPGRKVLLAPSVVLLPQPDHHHLRVSLTRAQVEQSPDVSTDLPVARQKRIELHHHYSWPTYWGPVSLDPWPMNVPPQDTAEPSDEMEHPAFDPHLRSVHEVSGYHLGASDGSIGHVADFYANDATWEIRYLMVNTGDWLPGRRVLIPPFWLVRNINWASREVTVALSRDRIRHIPAFDPASPISPEMEKTLHDYYGSPTYGTTAEPIAK